MPPAFPDPEPILAPDGPIGAQFADHYESRPQQLDMARAVAANMAQRRDDRDEDADTDRPPAHLLVEAGTGVGKSFAYLVPAIQRIIEKRERVVIATNTIALQEQLIAKDIPVLEKAFTDEDGRPRFRAELVKGRGNYLSLRRLMLASQRADKLLTDAPSRRSLQVIQDWAYETDDGTLATLPPLERPGVWDHAQSDSGNCMGRKCPTYDKCFYQQARRRMERADLIITNHALFFSDLALRAKGIGILPRYHHVILDEAHNVEDVASEHFGVSIAEGRVRHLLGSLFNPRRNRGFLSAVQLTDDETGEASETALSHAITLVQNAGSAADHFFDAACRIVADRTGRQVGSVRLLNESLPNPITPAFNDLALLLKRLKDRVHREEDKYELNAYIERAAAIADDAEIIVERQVDAAVYWVETTQSRAFGVRAKLACSPIEVGPVLNATLFNGDHSVTLTSATLTTGASDAPSAFYHAKGRLGCDDAQTLALGSPFDHATLVDLHLDDAMPDPRAPQYLDALTTRILDHCRATDGGAFILFTSFATMYAAADRARPQLSADDMPVYVQGRDGSRSDILEAFRQSRRSILFGTASFWQGVDVRGDTLRNVIITRLPFDPPDRPITQARLELIQARGGNPFMEDSLPRAIIRFKQGFGRLVRSASDTGRVVVLDPRIRTARYGRLFLNALPEGIRVVSAEDATYEPS